MTAVPARARSPLPLAPLVGLVVALATAALVFIALPSTTSEARAIDATHATHATHATPATHAANANNATNANNTTNANTAAASLATPVTSTPHAASLATPVTSAPHAASALRAGEPAAGIARVDVAEAIPTPPPTSSTTPETAIAPEDQGGDANADTETASDVVTELPARKKAKGLTARGIASLRGGDVAGAEPLLVRAVLVDPSLADAWRHLGIARAQLGDVEGARRAYRKYLELAPKAPDAAQVRAILAAP